MDFTAKYITAIILVINVVGCVKSSVKIWKHDISIRNPSNWVGGKANTDCDGLDLHQNEYTLMVLNDLNVKKITLPLEGALVLSNTFIEFNENSKDIMNCARIKRLEGEHFWEDPGSWIVKDDDENVAIPHYERVPCKYDDIIFPKGFESGYCILMDDVEIKSIKFGDDYLKYEDLKNDKNLRRFIFIIPVHDTIHISGKACTNPTGCVCREDSNFDGYLCMNVNDNTNLSCVNPIMPIGFCTEICGASILLKPKINFQIAEVKNSLKYYSSDTYVSKVRNGSVEVIQIIFTEKQFSGSSLDEARDYFSQLLADETVEAKSVELHSSGPYFVEGETTRSALSIVFGSLCGVVLLYAVLFLIYSPRFAALNVRDRFFLSSRSFSSFKSNLFARYDKTENAELILERHSSAGSIINLDKSFENPMFGKSTLPAASTSYGSIHITDDKVTKSEISLENPMYEINNLDESVQEAIEENLVSLIEKEE